MRLQARTLTELVDLALIKDRELITTPVYCCETDSWSAYSERVLPDPWQELLKEMMLFSTY